MLPDRTECQPFVCLVRAGTEGGRDSFKNMHVVGISGRMFHHGGGGDIVPSANPSLETFFFHGAGHYLQKEPRAAAVQRILTDVTSLVQQVRAGGDAVLARQ